MPLQKLNILYNESCRQRAMDGYYTNIDKKAIEDFEKIHGNYTAGFHKNELLNLRSKLNAV